MAYQPTHQPLWHGRRDNIDVIKTHPGACLGSVSRARQGPPPWWAWNKGRWNAGVLIMSTLDVRCEIGLDGRGWSAESGQSVGIAGGYGQRWPLLWWGRSRALPGQPLYPPPSPISCPPLVGLCQPPDPQHPSSPTSQWSRPAPAKPARF